MTEQEKKYIISIIEKREKTRSLSRLKRLSKEPMRTFLYYCLASVSHIRPYVFSFKTLWGTRMTSYLPEGNTFYYYGYCEANMTSFFLRHLKEGDCVLDIGAHVGFYSMLTSALVGERGSVHAFEPTPWTYTLLQKNTQSLKNVVTNNKAVSDRQEKISFKDYGPGYGAYNTAHKDGSILKWEPKVINAETVSLDEYCKITAITPTFVKLDAEGYELTILHGMEYLLKDVRPLITLEVAGGDTWSSNCKQSIEFLIDKGYVPYEMAVNGEVRPHVIKDMYVYDNLLFVPEEKKNIL